jgi:DNA mismatch repair protein MutS2
MISKHINTLELPKILARLSNHCAFTASIELAQQLKPATNATEVQRRLAETSEAKEALLKNDQLSIGGAHDVREPVRLAARGGTLEPKDLLDVRDTVESGRRVQRALSRFQALYPNLTAITNPIEPLGALVTEISRAIDDSGEVRDTASDQLAVIRRQTRIVHDRLLQKLQRMVSDGNNTPYLQEALVTQRGGRYVIPIKSDFKGRIPGLIHDQSASGLTLFIEPLATLDLNNEWRELQLAEEREVRRILLAISARVGEHADAVIRTVEALAQFDLALAKAKYSEAVRGVAASVELRTAKGEQNDTRRSPFVIVQARHPLLNPESVVPIDVELQGETRVLVITGPNTGGKTVALKTVGLFVLMTQCGLHVPAERAALPVFKNVYADIGDEQSIEQSLSTFSSHLTNLVSFFEKVDAESLVLLDELGAGTDPVEGAAMARAMLEYLLTTKAICMVATHYPELKAWAYVTAGVVNASMAFDDKTLRPLYKLTVGLPGRSNAFAIAQRLNVPKAILDQAQSYIDGNTARAEDMLAEISKMQRQAEAARAAARRAEKEAEQNSDRLRARLNQIEEERKQLLAKAQDDALKETENLRAEVRRLRARIVAAGGSLIELKAIEKETEQAADTAAQSRAESLITSLQSPTPKRTLRPGDTVRVKSLNTTAEVNEIIGGEADVQVGRMRMRVKLSDLERIRGAQPLAEKQERVTFAEKPASPGMELDLRGMTAEEGVSLVEDYVDRAARAALPFARIIHGKGTGVLRQAVRNALKAHPFVKSFETGQDGEGGDGVTVVKFKE